MNSPKYGYDSIPEFANHLSPKNIEIPECFLLLGMLTGSVLGDKSSKSEKKEATETLYKIHSEWQIYCQKQSNDGLDYLTLTFIAQLNTIVGFVEAKRYALQRELEEARQIENDPEWYKKFLEEDN